MNIQFEYLFRDEGNYKTHGYVVFTNKMKISPDFISHRTQEQLIEGTLFDPDQWQIPRFSFHQVNTFGIDDYLWYEFGGVKQIRPDNIARQDISDWLKSI